MSMSAIEFAAVVILTNFYMTVPEMLGDFWLLITYMYLFIMGNFQIKLQILLAHTLGTESGRF